jgi:hypothetical protein
MVISSACIILQCSIYPRTAAASIYVTMVGATPYKLFLRVPWVNKQLASSDFTFNAFFHSKLLKIEAAMAFWVLT